MKAENDATQRPLYSAGGGGTKYHLEQSPVAEEPLELHI